MEENDYMEILRGILGNLATEYNNKCRNIGRYANILSILIKMWYIINRLDEVSSSSPYYQWVLKKKLNKVARCSTSAKNWGLNKFYSTSSNNSQQHSTSWPENPTVCIQ